MYRRIEMKTQTICVQCTDTTQFHPTQYGVASDGGSVKLYRKSGWHARLYIYILTTTTAKVVLRECIWHEQHELSGYSKSYVARVFHLYVQTFHRSAMGLHDVCGMFIHTFFGTILYIIT